MSSQGDQEIRFTADLALLAKLQRLRELLAHQTKDTSHQALFHAMEACNRHRLVAVTTIDACDQHFLLASVAPEAPNLEMASTIAPDAPATSPSILFTALQRKYIEVTRD